MATRALLLHRVAGIERNHVIYNDATNGTRRVVAGGVTFTA